ncbi:hypothetical protein A5701_15305 [Mycobacterium sp. E3305]|nr:hypothetical protein A5701_15305 [Mycobacterium sp. E3305]
MVAVGVTVLVIVGIVVAVVAGIGIHKQQSDALKAQWAPPAPAMVHYSAPEQRYLDHLRNVLRVGDDETRDLQLVNTGHMVCNDLSKGVGMSAEIMSLEYAGRTPLESHAIVNLAFSDLCPRVYG